MSLLSWLLVILAGLSLAAMVVSISIASRSAREARSTIFPVVREEEAVRARRARIVTSVMGVIAAIMAGAFFLSGQLPDFTIPTLSSPAEPLAVAEPVITEAEAPEVEADVPTTPADTPVPLTEAGETPANIPAALATLEAPPLPATPTLALPSLTPIPALSATLTPVPHSPTANSSPVQAPASVKLGPITFATQVTGHREPIRPTTVFSSDIVSQVYASFPYDGMRNGLTWTYVWYFNDSVFSRGEETWQWGSADRSFIFTKLVGAGDYRLELYVNDDLLASGEFTVQGPIAIGGPKLPEGSGTPENPPASESQKTPDSPESSVTPQSP